MQTVGTASWRLSESVSQLLGIALYSRDAAGLVLPDAESPPPLRGPVLVNSSLDPAERLLGGAQWAEWWHRLVAFEVRSGQPLGDADRRATMRARVEERQRLLDPPDFTSLADRPELRAAVRNSFDAAHRLERHTHAASESTHVPWALASEVAEQVAFDRGVPLDAIDAVVLVVDVAGPWWRRVAPGAVLCSPAVGADRQAATAMLYDGFASRLTG